MINLTTVRQKLNKPGNVFLILSAAWLILNLFQALFMEVISDEAYYGLYGKYLDWGYYDHPPMVALLTRISSLLFAGNLGIRFMTVILQFGTLLLVWKIIDDRKPDSSSIVTFFIIAGSISMFSAYGIFTTPDVPLLFFTALFLLSCKKFIADQKWTHVLLISVSMAGLIYSKYQAVLVIGFVILSNIRLLKYYKFWVAGIVALVLLVPHIYWQFDNNFPSLQYHLVDRSEEFRWIYFFEYLPYQLAVFNPFTFGAAAFILIKYRPEGHFNRILYLQIAGFIFFFWLICFRGHVEPHWTVACSIPMIILIYEKSLRDASLYRYTRKYILPSIALLMTIRIFLLIDSDFNRYLGFSGRKERSRFIEYVAGDLPVVFTGSFQRPSLYRFFTGKEATVISSLDSRQTQFDIWQFEKNYHNKPVFVCTGPDKTSQSYGEGWDKIYGFRTDSLQTVNRMKIFYDLPVDSFTAGDSISLFFTIENTYEYDIDFNHRYFPVKLCMMFIKGETVNALEVNPAVPLNIISAGKTVSGSFSSVIPDLPKGEYRFGISLNTLFGPPLNSKFKTISIAGND